MASNRDPRKSYRVNRRGRRITSSADRAKRVKKSTVPRPTSSSTRGSTKGSSRRVTTGQGGSRARFAKPKARSTGLIGTRNTPTTKTTYSGPPGLGKVKFNPSKRISTAAKIGAIVNPKTDLPAKAVAAGSLVKDSLKSLNKRPSRTKDKVKPTPGMAKGAVKKAKSDAAATNKASTIKSFDSAFSKARKAGKKTFTWRGKSYTTKMAK